MQINYVHLRPDEAPPAMVARPYRAVMIAKLDTSQSWRNDIASWLVQSGCLYFIAWGTDCEAWHDTVDWTVLEGFNFGDIPDDKFVMTTWHDKEPLAEALWFAGHSASHPDVVLHETVIVHVAPEEQRVATLQCYNESQGLADGS
ncbi:MULTISPECIES: hypothetical protein [Sphingomonas]|jgi:hypothetical protein|uniref:DUF7684 family protein n=1 Tax=Sphingomonas TaxID=13687 RepID=UPI0004DB5429|nr:MULTISPECIES: hypothetical protein [Sphingomonas]KQM99908.1 hypothetical protein ASE77_02960 [Sphingomonas sp. Leaf226]MBD8735701.1 hypothetical protein [Sphingomonas sp. CFBP 13706]MDY0965645.1 hypothetical protein [Sphingomonas sp. CFBP9021]USQ99309.1 hypothetical protein NEF64_12815 [Sphingomonas aerolata]